MKENGEKTRERGMESLLPQMNQFIRVNGSQTNKMEKEFYTIQQAKYMKETLKRGNKMVMGF